MHKYYNKIKTIAEISRFAKRLKHSGTKIVFTNGCFDLLHIGHISYLTKAKSLGDILIIGLNSDNSVKKLKGKSRPITLQRERAIVLSALEVVDFIIIFNELTPLKLIKAIKPDVLVKGGDWKKENIVGAAFVESYGGSVKSLAYLKGSSTKNLIKKIRNAKF